MAWYNKDGNDKDIILSSRVRFARNLVDYPFASRMDDTSANEIIEKIESALGGALTKRQLDYYSLDNLITCFVASFALGFGC